MSESFSGWGSLSSSSELSSESLSESESELSALRSFAQREKAFCRGAFRVPVEGGFRLDS